MKTSLAKVKFAPLLLVFLFVFSAACKKKDDEVKTLTPNEAALKKSIVENYAAIVYASYQDSYTKAVALKDKIDEFVESPTAEGLTAAKNAWLESRIPYLQTEAYRFYGGPIDDEDGPEGLINAWPMDEVYIDYVVGDGDAGIINDPTTYPTIDADFIAGKNEDGGETNISTGYHAIEFLLWGQDLNTNGPGNRPYTDYDSGPDGTAANQARRGQYLKAAAELLVENLEDMVNQWKPNANNYCNDFVTAPSDESIAKILLGIGSLTGGELAGERMLVAYDSKLQEDEHSCFSDNTHNDIVLDAKGINNVYFGKYTRVDGTVIDGIGLDELAALKNSTLNTKLTERLATTKTLTEAIQPPFDQEIVSTDGRARVLAAIESLQTQADVIVEVATSLGIHLEL